MNYWRMSFRTEINGAEMWPDCYIRGIAAITYRTIDGKAFIGDCSKLTEDEYNAIWKVGWPENTCGRASLRHMVYHMKVGDIIYVKQGPYIVGKGRVRAAYKYDPTILKGAIEEWEHYLTVDWEKDFPKFRCVLGADIWPVLPLNDARLKQVLAGEAKARQMALKHKAKAE